MPSEFRLMPEQASSIAGEVDALYWFLITISTIFTVLIAFFIIYFAIKYRRGSPADRTVHHSHFLALEVTWITIPFLLTMVMFFWGAKLYFQQARPPADAMEITCVGRQWMWKFQHPEGRSEINDLHVPIGQAIKVRLISEDVIHSLYIPAFRVKHDVLPGRYTSLWFRPTKLGQYHLFCAEYCGAKHSEMIGTVHVMELSKYQEWLSGRTAGEAPAVAGRRLFEELRCDSCHAGGGTQSRGPALEDLFGKTVTLTNGQTVVADEAYIRESILRPASKVVAGFQTVMPTFEGRIGEEGIMQLIAYIKSLSPADPDQPNTGTADPADRTGPERSQP